MLQALKVDIVPAADLDPGSVRRGLRIAGKTAAKYVIRVPRKTELERITTSNGSIRISDIEGMSRLRTSNGSVHALSIKGDLEARTSNGGIEVADCQGGVSETSTAG